MNAHDKPVRILLAHTQPAARRFLAKCLKDQGYDVLRIDDPTDLLEELTMAEDGLPIDLVVAAVNLDGIATLDVLQEARECGVETPFVLLNWGGDDVVREADALDAVVLDYPFDLSDMVEMVEAVLDDTLEEQAAA